MVALGHDIVTMQYEIILMAVLGTFCSKMCTGIHKLLLCMIMVIIAKFPKYHANPMTCAVLTMQVHNKCSCCVCSIASGYRV